MKRLSSKATVYLVDGSNFSMRFLDRDGGALPDELEREFMRWLDEVSRTEVLRASCFRVVFDGPYRRAAAVGPAITVYYSDSEPADDMLVERGYFMRTEGVREVIVTSDNGLRDRVPRHSSCFRARSRTRSASKPANAFNCGFKRSICRMWASANSTTEISPDRSISSCRIADSITTSFMAAPPQETRSPDRFEE